MTDHFAVYEHIRSDTGEVFYVGKGCPTRVSSHSREYNKHHARIRAKLQKMGLDIEVRVIWNNLPDESACTLEKMRISYLRAIGVRLVNLTDGGEGMAGYKPTAATLKKRSKALKGIKRTEENIAGMRNRMRADPEIRDRIGAFQRGKSKSAEWRAASAKKLRRSFLTLKKKERHRQGCIASMANRVISAETRAKMSESAKRRVVSAETRAKMSAALKGRTMSAETRAKISAAAKRRAEKAA